MSGYLNGAASVKSEKSVIQKKKSDNPWHLRENNIKLQIVSPTDIADAHGCGCAGEEHGFLRSHSKFACGELQKKLT